MLAAVSFPFSKKKRKEGKEETGTQRVEMPELREVLRTGILHNARKNAYEYTRMYTHPLRDGRQGETIARTWGLTIEAVTGERFPFVQLRVPRDEIKDDIY